MKIIRFRVGTRKRMMGNIERMVSEVRLRYIIVAWTAADPPDRLNFDRRPWTCAASNRNRIDWIRIAFKKRQRSIVGMINPPAVGRRGSIPHQRIRVVSRGIIGFYENSLNLGRTFVAQSLVNQATLKQNDTRLKVEKFRHSIKMKID